MTLSKPQFNTPDDQALSGTRSDLTGGINSRTNPTAINDNQAAVLYNADIATKGQTSKRLGSFLAGDDSTSTDSILALHNFSIQGGVDQLIRYSDTDLEKWEGSGDWATIDTPTTGATEVGIISAKMSGISPDDCIIVQNGIDNPTAYIDDGTADDLGDPSTNENMPLTTVMGWYQNRVWYLKDDLLGFSDAYQATYEGAFDQTTNVFRVPVGDERGIVPTRDTGLVIMGQEAIWGLAPSVVPDPATDKPEPLVTNRGVVSKKGWVNAGDDIYYFAQDGFRALKRTLQDKLQAGTDNPISYFMKDEYDRIDFNFISRLCMEYFDNKIIIAVPTGANTFDTWIYYLPLQSFTVIQGWYPRCFAKYKVNGEERLYYGRHVKKKVYRAFNGQRDELTNKTDTTIEIGASALCTFVGHCLLDNQAIRLSTTGTLPSGLAEDTTYYVIYVSADTFRLSATSGGSAITTSGTQSGTHTVNVGTAINYQEEGKADDVGAPLLRKSGGYVKIEAAATGDYDVSVYASFDSTPYVLLGLMNLQGSLPRLPINLPFNLADAGRARKVFHIDPYGPWFTIQLKLVHNDFNGSDDIKFYSRSLATFISANEDL
jgi:hypothetical protein